ncbi:MAG: hypothetical protein M0Z41_03060, partial [Peptococcaceae bacterium]|nr:hypothetical protein [Peptococcaceae bacterium]
MNRSRGLYAVFGPLLAVALLAAGTFFPGRAMALGTVSVLSSPNVTTSFTGNLGTVQINGVAVSPGQSDDFVLTVPGGVTLNDSLPMGSFIDVPQYNPGTMVQNAFWPGQSVSAATYVSRFQAGQSSLSFWITAGSSSAAFSGIGSVLVSLPVSSVAGAAPGPVDVSVWDTDNLVPHGVIGSGTLLNNPGEQLAITNSTLPAATAGVPYNAAVTTNGGGYAPYTFSLSAG